jgi:hypothetical protein
MVYDRATDRYLPISWDQALAKIDLVGAIRQRWRHNKARFAVAPRGYNSKPQGVAGNAALPPYFEGSL